MQSYAQKSQLGSPRIVYEPKGGSLFIFGPLALLLGGMIIGAYLWFYNSVFSWWPTWQAWLVLGVGAVWLFVGLWIICISLIHPRLRVYLCPKGLIYMKRTCEVIRWDEIDMLSKEIIVQKQPFCSYTIRRNDGVTFELDHQLPHVERLGGFMEREVTRHLLPQAIAAFKAGKIQEFADIFVSERGIGLKSARRILHWDELEKIAFDGTLMSLYRKGYSWAWTTLSISGMPNVGVLQGIVQHVKSEMRERILREVVPIQSSLMQAYDAGFAISFGKLSLSKAGVSINNNTNEDILPWDEIASFGVGEDEIIIKRSGLLEEWYTLPAWTISDLVGLRQLVDYALWRQE